MSAILHLPLEPLTDMVLRSYWRKANNPGSYEPEAWLPEAEARLRGAGVDIKDLAHVADLLRGPESALNGGLFFNLCQARRPLSGEADWRGMRSQEAYERLLMGVESQVGASREAIDFASRLEEYLYGLFFVARPDWLALSELIEQELATCLRDLGQTDRDMKCYQATLEAPGALVNAALRNLCANLAEPERPRKPLTPGGFDGAAPQPHEAPLPPEPWLWPLPFQARALFSKWAGFRSPGCLDSPLAMIRIKRGLRAAGLDVELLERMARLLPLSREDQLDGEILLELCQSKDLQQHSVAVTG
ncbi:MAG: hypothetical protein V1806_05895 [Pseudomonadota bacterium]